MNKVINLISVLCLVVLFTTSCEKEPILEVSQSSLTFVDGGGTQTISFSTNKDWTASVSGGTGWCTISPTSGKSEIKTITVTTVANTTYDDRTATITINAEELSKVITITQPKNRAIILTKDSYEVGAAGGNISVELNSNIEFDVTIPTENQSWITNTTTKGLAKSTLTFAILPNGTYDNRVGKIIIKDKTTALADTVIVTQAQKDAIILTQKTFNVADTLIVISVELKSNITYKVTIPAAEQLWITQLQTKGLTTDKLYFSISPNLTKLARKGQVIIKHESSLLSDTITINQSKLIDPPLLMTEHVYYVPKYYAVASAVLLEDWNSKITERGFCYSLNNNPTIADSKIIEDNTDIFTSIISSLSVNQTYYFRAYAINRGGISYGETLRLTTSFDNESILYPGTEYYAQKIGNTWWAPVNVGFSNERPYGKIFQWHRKYGQEYISTGVIQGPVSLMVGNDMNNASIFYTGGNDWTSQPQNSWSMRTEFNPCPSGWRVPTEIELKTLLNSGHLAVDEGLNNIPGRWFGENYSNSIFLPLSGYRDGSNGGIQGREFTAAYWSTYSFGQIVAVSLQIHSKNHFNGTAFMAYPSRSLGASVRCVKE